MKSITDIIEKVDAFAQVAGIKPSQVCRAATGNPRLYDRLKRRAEQTQADATRLEEYMAKNQPEQHEAGAAQ